MKEKYELIFEDAKPNDEIYQDSRIVAVTFRRPRQKREPKHLDEYSGIGGHKELEADVERELEWRKENAIRQSK